MNDEAQAQEIQGTVVSSGRFPEPAADDPREPAAVTDPAEAGDPEDQEDLEEERSGSTNPGYGRVAADREDEDEDDDELDPDAVIIAEVVEEPDDDEAPEPVAGFVRTPAASPESATAPGDEAGTSAEDARTAASAAGLGSDPEQLHEQWSAIQSSFVDDPRASVSAAAELVNEAITSLVARIQERERALRGDWERDGADTENLRNALRGYRGLLDQVVAR
ncbi:MAG TPA: hypothetical protein VMC03_04965 [Streptosporangiaceae bacterium]|nr:hypothetical protein [Streptosporangiaceae bacterium]